MDTSQSVTSKHLYLSNRKELQNYFDGSISTDDGFRFLIHRVLLSQKSGFFQGMFFFYRNREFRDVTLSGIGGATMRRVLSFLYTGKVQLSSFNIVDTLLAADFLLVEELLKYCQVFIAKEVSASNCIPMFVACSEIGMDIKGELYRFIQTHFEEVVKNSPGDIGILPEESLGQILGDTSINISSEKTVWEAIALWVDRRTPERYAAVPRLVSRIIPGEIDEVLSAEILSNPIVKENVFCAEINTYILTKPALSNREYLEHYIRSLQRHSSQIIESRQPTSVNYIAIYRAMTEERTLELYQTYDQQIDVWMKVGQMNLDFIHTFDYFVRLRNSLFVFDTWGHQCLSFDFLERRWIGVRSMFFSRSHYCVVEADGRIYLLGGVTHSNDAVPFVEYYDQAANEWCPVCPFHPMILTDAVSLQGHIYAFGHSADGEETAMVAQVYSPVFDVWTIIQPPSVTRYRFCAVATGSTLCLIGGESDDYLTSVEEYDPESQEWRDLPDLPLPYWLPRAVEVCGTIYIYDDYDEGRRFCRINPPVYWNAEKENWIPVSASSPMFEMDRYLFCNVSDPITVKKITVENRRHGCQWENSPFTKKY